MSDRSAPPAPSTHPVDPSGTDHAGTEPAGDGAPAAERIAVIGMSCRFPGSPDPETFWRNLRDGVEGTTFYSPEEMLARGVPQAAIDDPAYVCAGSVLDDADLFDAAFFEVPHREAEILDPQARLFLEVAWEAMERAGYGLGEQESWVGVFAGTTASTYQIRNLFARQDVMGAMGFFPIYLANDRDYFATRVSYKLNLRGPSVNVQTACSTSLTALHMACQSLLDYQCGMALVGGVRVWLPQGHGYAYQEGGIVSEDGHTRAFDARGTGTIFGNGAGALVLKRYEEAVADGDPILAVVLGSGINNDGSSKLGFTAPSIEGQAEAITLALEAAQVSPETISYVEAHGSGTPLGDPIEVAALTEAFRAGTEKTGYCALGSVKTNIGHLESAAGAAGLIKTILSLQNRQLPPSLSFEEPNPKIDFPSSPFFVNDRLRPWETPGENGSTFPRRAGVSSFGVGGTNVHVILEEAPKLPPSGPSRPWQLLLLSARGPDALEAATDRLARHLRAEDGEQAPLADVAYTLQVGRRRFEHRRALVVRDGEDAAALLADRHPRRLLSAHEEADERPVTFLFSGLGDHYVDMARGLYRDEPTFREELDLCAEILEGHLGVDIRTLLYPKGTEHPDPGHDKAGRDEVGATSDSASPGGLGKLDLKAMLGRGGAGAGAERSPEARALDRTEVLQPALFAIEWALTALWMDWGVVPTALMGYSLGEYTAAAVAGVLSLEDALELVAERARLVDALPEGSMTAVPLGENDTAERIAALKNAGANGEELDVAVATNPGVTVVAGPTAAVAAFEERLSADGITCRRLATTHAFHSRMLEPAMERLAKLAAGFDLQPPSIPMISNVTGTWLTDEEAVDPEYWARHLVGTVRFGDGLAELLDEPQRIYLEVGPGKALGSIVLQHPKAGMSGGGPHGTPVVLASLRSSFESRPDQAFALGTLAELWLAGAAVPDWKAFYRHEDRRRAVLPTYPFQRRRYWIDPPAAGAPPQIPGAARGGEAGAPAGTAEAAAAAGRGSGAPGAPGGAPAMAGGQRMDLHPRPNLRNPYVAPETDLQREVAGVWRKVLGVQEVGVHDSFFDLGGNSLLAPQVLLTLKRDLDVDLPLPLLFAAPTAGEMAEVVHRVRSEGLEAVLADEEKVDLRAEIRLDESIRPAGGFSPEQLSDPKNVFLTGASGFVGAYLLAALLDQTDARVCCLVRADDAESGLERIRRNMERHSLWKPVYEVGATSDKADDESAAASDAKPAAGRILAIPGDLAEPRLGLSEAEFDRLARETDAVFHGGAWVNFTYPYSVLADANVEGTREALRLACLERTKPFHFVSSISVFSPGSLVEEPEAGERVAYEDSDLPVTEGLFSGYAETKWVGEKIVRLAEERGLPVTIHRPGVVGGGSDTGSGNTSDMVWAILRGSIQLGKAMPGIGRMNVAPADYVARALVHLSKQEESLGKAFQYPNPEPMNWDDAFGVLRDMGYRIEMVHPIRFRDELLAAARAGTDNALIPFLPMLGLGSGVAGEGPTAEEAEEAERLAAAAREEGPGPANAGLQRRDDGANTRAGLEGSGISCPPVSPELLQLYVRHFVEIGFVPGVGE